MRLNLFIKICVGEWEEKICSLCEQNKCITNPYKYTRKEIIKSFSKALRLLRNVSGVQLICAVFTHLLIIKELSLNG